jgi:hypothetical protein
MAKASKQQNADITLNSIKDLGYQFSSHLDKINTFADAAKQLIPSIVDGEISDEEMAELKLGIELRYNDLHPAQVYMREGADNYVPVDKAIDGKNCVSIGVHQAMAYSEYEFGKLRKDTPNLHSIVGEIRYAFGQYASTKIKRLIASCKPQAERKRSVNLSFDEFVEKTKNTMFTRAKNAKAKGDTKAPTKEQLTRAWAAFNLELTK